MTKNELKIQRIDNLYFNNIYFLDPTGFENLWDLGTKTILLP